MSELEETVDYLHSRFARYRRLIFWSVCLLLLFLLLLEVREVAALLLASYGIALLLDPIVSKLEARGISRAISVIGIGGSIVFVILLLVLLALPQMITESQELIANFPAYAEKAVTNLGTISENWFGVEAPKSIQDVADEVKGYLSAVGSEQLQAVGKTVGQTALRGYSLALTVFNIFLLPFFVFYIARDLRAIHRAVGSFMDEDIRTRLLPIAKEILGHVYAFFEGQLIVSLVLALLYVIGFSIVGLPWSVVVGTMTGLLNIVPYLGTGIGFLLATVLSLVSEPSLSHLLSVYAVIAVIQLFEGNFLTPKIVGESVGIHPLGVMVALIVGGDLFGLLGMILAIPAAAAARVLFYHALAALDDADAPASDDRASQAASS